MPCECGLEQCVYFDCEIQDAVVDPKRIRKLEKDFSKEDWKWDSLDLEEDAFFADVTFTLTEKNELKQILPRMWDWCCESGDTIIFAKELSKALKEGSVILKFYYSEYSDPWGLKIEPNKVQLLKMELVPTREVKEKEDIRDLLQSLELPRFENLQEDVIVRMSPLKERTVKAKVVSVEKANPHIVEPIEVELDCKENNQGQEKS